MKTKINKIKTKGWTLIEALVVAGAALFIGGCLGVVYVVCHFIAKSS